MPPKPFSARALPFTLLCSLAASFVLAAASVRADEATPGYSDVVEVRVVNLQVTVTNAAGERVTGLKPAHFRLTVDGEATPIAYFSEVASGQAVADPARPGSDPGAALASDQPVPTNYLLFVDESSTDGRERRRIVERLARQLHVLGPEDRMAVVAYDGRRLERLTGWTGSAQDIDRALANVGGRLQSGSNVKARQSGLNRCGEILRMQKVMIQNALGAASVTLRSFSYLSGRNVLLLLSDDWELDPEYCVDERLEARDRAEDRGPEFFRQLSNTANQFGYVIYPIDLKPESGHALELLAAETGGQVLHPERDDEILPFVAADTRSYYWLGFHAERRPDDRRRPLEVELVRPELSLRYKPSYIELSNDRLAAMQLESQLLFGEAPETQPLAATLATARRTGRDRLAAPLTVRFPVDSLTAKRVAGGGYELALELHVAALDDLGRRIEMPPVPFTVAGKTPPQPGQTARYDTVLELRNRPQTLAIAVHDPDGIVAYSTTVEFAP